MDLKITSVVIDCANADKLADFWAAATGYEKRGVINQYAILRHPEKTGINLLFQQVDEPKISKNRVHLDMLAPDQASWDAEIARLIGLGASKKDVHEELGIKWAVMADPEGNEFCVAVH